MKKIVVTGSNGQLGSEIRDLVSRYTNFEFIFAYRCDFSFENKEEIISFLDKNKPDYIVNCAAYTAVDKAESEIQLSDLINYKAVEIIGKWSAKNNCKLVHVSTDYVFDGTSSIALKEGDQTNPQNQYGKSKLLGELACIENNPESIIIRTSWVYSKFGNNFVKTILRLMEERDTINVVNDQIGSPTYAKDLAIAILVIINSGKWYSGIYNFSNEGEVSWFDFALAIQKISGTDCDVKGISSLEYPTLAKRPFFSLLDKSKIKKTYGVEIPHYKESLKSCLSK